MSETETPEPTPEEGRPLEDATQRVVDAARDVVANELADTEVDEKLARLAQAVDELDQTKG